MTTKERSKITIQVAPFSMIFILIICRAINKGKAGEFHYLIFVNLVTFPSFLISL